MKKLFGYLCLFAVALLVLGGMTSTASAQTDITSAITSVSGYWTAAEVIALGIVLFVVGRKVLRKI